MLFIYGLLISLIGLVLPGYALAFGLGLNRRWFVAFPFSILLLVELVILYAIFNIQLSFFTFMCAMLGASLLSCLPVIVKKKKKIIVSDMPIVDKKDCKLMWLTVASIGFATLIAMAVLFRAISYPLSGLDTYFRWEGLARQMFSSKSLEFYPPVTPQNFAIYLIPDGIPPLVASVYWWLYAAMGQIVPQVTSLSVVLQLCSCMALTFFGALHAFGRRAAAFSLIMFASSPLLINGFAIGQETGITALSVAGQFCFTWAAVRKPRANLVIAAAIFAALGALARDYGLALSLAGLLVLSMHLQTRRFVVLFISITLLLSAPWYIRNWVIAGNPLYPHAIPGFNSNEIFVAMQNSFHPLLSFYTYSFSKWLSIFGELLLGTPLAILGTIICLTLRSRESIPFLLLIIMMGLLWLLSLGETAGGAVYSMRVLTPAFVALAFLAGKSADYLITSATHHVFILRRTMLALFVICSIYSLANALSHPYSYRDVFSAIKYIYVGAPEFSEYAKEVTERLNTSDITGTGMLTSDPYLGTMLQRGSRFRPVMPWNPDVKFVFENNFAPEEIKSRLIANNIHLISLSNNDYYTPFFDSVPFYRWLRNNANLGRIKLFSVPGAEELYYLMPEPVDNLVTTVTQ